MLKKLFKSKTINFNILIPVAMMICGALEIDVPENVWAAVAVVGNFLLRFVTKEAIADK